MRAALSATLITPLVFWACGSTPGTDNMVVDSGVGPSDTGVRDTGVGGGLDAAFGDATITDASDGGFNGDSGTPDSGTPDAGTPDSGLPCTYPGGAVEPMAVNSVVTPYRWANAIDPSGATTSFDLTQFFCNTDPGHNFGQTEAILFVSSVAW